MKLSHEMARKITDILILAEKIFGKPLPVLKKLLE